MGELLSVKDKVEALVRRHKSLLDDDLKLKSNYWNEQLKELDMGDLRNITAHKFLEMHADGVLSNGDHITRIRRKLQEIYPELQTALWIKRHASSQAAVISDLDIIASEKKLSY